MSKRLAVFLLPAMLAVAQTAPNSVTVTATRSANVQPDQVIFAIGVSTSTSSSRDEVVAVLRGAGLSPVFSGVRSVQTFDPRRIAYDVSLDWSFTLTSAIADMKTSLDSLAAGQKRIADLKNGFAMSFSVTGTAVSEKAQQTQSCSMPDLIADARAQAQKLASAAATGVGPILAISGATTGPDTSNTSALGSPNYSPVCSLTVKFALGTL